MKHLDVAELLHAVPVAPAKMTRREKLLHWAKLVRTANRPLSLYHGLEYFPPGELTRMHAYSNEPTAFGLAVGDATFRAQGLNSPASVRDVMGFFELSQSQLHEFSCDCGGPISNRDMADRIQGLAD